MMIIPKFAVGDKVKIKSKKGSDYGLQVMQIIKEKKVCSIISSDSDVTIAMDDTNRYQFGIETWMLYKAFKIGDIVRFVPNAKLAQENQNKQL